MRIGVAGLGLIGGSVLRGLGDAVGYDADPAVRAAAAADGFEVVDAPDRLAGCELVLVAVPPAVTYEVSDLVLAAVPGAVVADTASVKGRLPERDRFVAAHPMAGSEGSGWAASSPGLLRGAVWAACPAGPALEPVCRLSDAVDRLEGRLVACSASDHDEAVARTSHLPHVVAAALAELAGDPLRAALSGTALRDMTRVARSDAALWASILSANREPALAALDELEAAIAGLRVALAGGDREVIARVWERAAGGLGVVDAVRWGETEWEERAIDGWDALLALGREGRAVRRLRSGSAGDLRGEVAR